MATINETLSGTLQFIGASGAALASQALAVTVPGTVGLGLVSSGSVGTSPVVQTLPGTTVNGVYIKNTHATQNLTVTWTPSGGSTATIILLVPGSMIIMLEAATGGGITALSLTGSGAGTTYDYSLVA